MMIAGASITFWLIVATLFALRTGLSLYEWYCQRRLERRMRALGRKS